MSEDTYNSLAIGCNPKDPNACQVSSGLYVNVWNIRPVDVRRDDIINALAKQCRFNGHCTSFYSVAQHSVHVAERVLELTGDARMARVALYHDAAEAYIGDLVRPIKRHSAFNAFRAIEENIMDSVYQSLNLWKGIGANEYEYTHAVIRDADNALLRLEAMFLMKGGGREWNWATPKPSFTRTIVPLGPVESAIFMDEYDRKLQEEIQNLPPDPDERDPLEGI